METLLRDLRHGVRNLVRMRAAGAAAIVMLTIGIGATTTAFSVMYAALLRRPPFSDPDRLAILYLTRTTPRDGLQRLRWSAPAIAKLPDAVSSFDALASFSSTSVSVGALQSARSGPPAITDAPEQLDGEIVSPDYFRALGVAPIAGRAFLPEEDTAGSGLPANCLDLGGKGYPEDEINPQASPNTAVLDDVSAFSNFMRFLAPPKPGSVTMNGQAVSAKAIAQGKALFSSIGCATCHNPSPGVTQNSGFVPALSHAQVSAFSDIEIHHMGKGLADNVSQGGAGGDQFRTAPLWGLGQRVFLLHDGRTTNLMTAIQDHASSGSEATTVIQNFDSLSATQQQELLDFLRSL